MGIELFINLALFLIAAFCFWDVGSGLSALPVPGMSAAAWPRIILSGLMITLAINIRALLKAKADPDNKKEIPLKELCPPKFAAAVAILCAYSLVIGYLGFLFSTALLVMALSYIIGLRNKKSLLIGAVTSSVSIYVIFQLALQVMLPRGVGIFREFGLWLEILTT